MVKLKYLDLTVTNTNDIREEINCRINMGNASYYELEEIYETNHNLRVLKLLRMGEDKKMKLVSVMI